MTDPGDRATTDANVRRDLPDAAPETVNPGIGEEGHDDKIKNNEREQARINSQNPDPLDK
ncbi:hypothetical protein D3875_05560 [Deinococcus cavernae]|uniref:Uncharacterized protein n=1 Tax=Deinococcus cavernae TaxID=2320857 RepID=A0A418V514_9DEIO|nr:hypothetical protein [Deinococcus cavernae]RJF71127.1 hypothetical protein D3875_05560 [Deinococcus cavernae]